MFSPAATLVYVLSVGSELPTRGLTIGPHLSCSVPMLVPLLNLRVFYSGIFALISGTKTVPNAA